MGRIMSDAEIRRRKKVQGNISRTTSTLGLAGVGVGGAAALAARKPGALKAIQNLPKMKGTTEQGLKDAGLYTSLASGGIGGVGGYNFAAYTNAESRKRKQLAPVKKELGMDMGYYGEEGNQVKLPEIKVPIEKAWSPSANNYDSERSRKKRSKTYENAALVGAGAGGAYTASQGMKAVGEAKKVKPRTMVETETHARGHQVPKGVPQGANKPFRLAEQSAVPTKHLAPALKHGGKAAAGVAGVAAAAGIHGSLKRKRKGSWQPYAKRATTSAFGIDHHVGTEWTAP
jgi:hypothetical protein